MSIRGWTFNTEDIRTIRYRYSLRRLILVFRRRTVEIDMPQDLGEVYLKRITLAWSEDRSC
jgi:hypothetical protein